LLSAESADTETTEPTELKVLRDSTFKLNVSPKAKVYVGTFVFQGQNVDGPFTVRATAAGKAQRSVTTSGGEAKLGLRRSEFPVYIVGENPDYRTTEPFRLDSRENLQFLIPVIRKSEPGIRIAKLSTVPDEGFRFGQLGDTLLFAQDPARDSRVLFLKVGLESEVQTAKYVKRASVKVLKYERPNSKTIAGRYTVSAFQVVFAINPTDSQLTSLCKRYNVTVRNRLDEIITFNAMKDFYESDLEVLSREPNVNTTKVLSYGRAYSDVYFTRVSSPGPLSPHGPPVDYDLDQKISAIDPGGVVLEIRFAENGVYSLEVEFKYESTTIRSAPFLVSIPR
jgi:hypothetical protein